MDFKIRCDAFINTIQITSSCCRLYQLKSDFIQLEHKAIVKDVDILI